MMRLARKRIGLATDEIMVGDTMDTDIRAQPTSASKHPRPDRLYHAQILREYPYSPTRVVDRSPTGALAGPGCRLIQWLG
jgi:hypothetical protein